MNRVYLAASFARQAELRGYREQLADKGFICCSRWLDVVSNDDGVQPPANSHENCNAARKDIADIYQAEFFVLFSEAEDSYRRRGGRLVEFGIALACLPYPRIHIVGRRETVFHVLPEVRVHASWGECLESVSGQLRTELARDAKRRVTA